MEEEEILITCPQCGGRKIIDSHALYVATMKTDKPGDMPKGVTPKMYTCLDCGWAFTAQEERKDGLTKKDLNRDEES